MAGYRGARSSSPGERRRVSRQRRQQVARSPKQSQGRESGLYEALLVRGVEHAQERPPSAQHIAALTALQRDAGNVAVARLIASAQRTATGRQAVPKDHNAPTSPTIVPALIQPVQRGLWDTVSGAAGRVWGGIKDTAAAALQWGMRNIVAPLGRLGSTAATAVGGFATKVAQGLATVRPRWGDLLNPHQLVFRSMHAVRRRFTADLVAAERRERAAAAAARGGPVGADPGPGPIEQADIAARRVEDMTGGSQIADELVEGAVLGDFKENPTGWNTVGQIAMGFVPYAGQVADARDTVASINKLRKGGWRDPWEWLNFGLTLVAWVPGVGDAIKGLGRGGIRVFRGSGAKIARHARRLWDGVRRGVPRLLGKAAAFGRRLWGGARRLGRGVLDGARNLGRRAADAGRRLWTGAKALGRRAIDTAGDLLRRARAKGSELLSRARGLLGRAAAVIRSLADRAFRGAEGLVRRGLNAVSTAWNRAKQVASDIARRAADKLAAARRWAAETLAKARDAASRLFTRVRTAAASAWTRAVNAGRALVRRVTGRIRKFITQDIPGLTRRLVNWARGKVRALRDRISDSLRQKWDELKRKLGIKKKFKRTPAEYDDLARDPAHGNQLTPKGVRERQAGVDLEARGEIPGPIRRDPNPAGAEFIDVNGTKWDVKAFNSRFPPKKGGFSVADAERKILKELTKGENVILDTQDLTPQHLQQLRQLVASRAWGSRIRWWP